MVKKYLSFSYIKNNISMVILIVVSFILRFINLGYSDFQGDEIKALYLPEVGQSFFNFILDQRKGPIQFIITYLLKFLDPNYNNQLFIRLPFALAGFFSVVFFYKFVKIHFGEKIAFYSSIFFSTNGFLVAFSRIVQYQSFVIFFMILSLYFLSLACYDEKYKTKGIFLGLVSWALSILSHYDGIFIAPFVFYLLYFWFKNIDLPKELKLRTFILAGLVSSSMILIFYIPFIKTISDSTMEYWEGRITGDVSGKISSSKYLFTVYQPIYVIHIYTILSILGLGLLLLGFLSPYIKKINKLPKIIKKFFAHTTDIMRSVQLEKLKYISLGIWILTAVIFFEWYVYISGTHVYNYLVPVFIILAFGLIMIESLVFKIFEYNLVRAFNFIGILILFIFLFLQSYAVFVDNYREYPWEEEKFFIWKFPKPTPIFHLSMFGFPYYRDWEEIRNFVEAHPEINAYSTNERKPISRYYIGLDKGSDKAGFYIHIKDPQSFTGDITDEKASYWSEKYEPVYTLTRFGRDMVRIYIMEPGTLQEIIEKGH